MIVEISFHFFYSLRYNNSGTFPDHTQSYRMSPDNVQHIRLTVNPTTIIMFCMRFCCLKKGKVGSVSKVPIRPKIQLKLVRYDHLFKQMGLQ